MSTPSPLDDPNFIDAPGQQATLPSGKAPDMGYSMFGQAAWGEPPDTPSKPHDPTPDAPAPAVHPS